MRRELWCLASVTMRRAPVDRTARWTVAAQLAVLTTVVTVFSACGDASGGGEPITEIIDPAAAVAANDPQPQDVVAPAAPGTSDDTDESPPEATPDDADAGEINPLEIRGEIISEFNLAKGECFNRVEGLQAGRKVATTARVDCADPHFAEVSHTFDLDVAHPGIYPGDDAMRQFARRTCYDHFEPFVGTSYETSVYEIDVFTPNRTNFEDEVARYRGVHCWLHHVDNEPLLGTAQGTAR